MNKEYEESIYRYFRIQIAYWIAMRTVLNPCEINVAMLEYFSDMSDYEFKKMLFEAVYKIDKNKEKRETGIEAVPQNGSSSERKN